MLRYIVFDTTSLIRLFVFHTCFGYRFRLASYEVTSCTFCLYEFEKWQDETKQKFNKTEQNLKDGKSLKDENKKIER